MKNVRRPSYISVSNPCKCGGQSVYLAWGRREKAVCGCVRLQTQGAKGKTPNFSGPLFLQQLNETVGDFHSYIQL